MKKPNYDLILKSKIDYYGETRAAYDFAANEYAFQKVEYYKMHGSVLNEMTKKEKERLVSLLTSRYNVDELNELCNLLKKDGCKIDFKWF